MKTLLHRAGDRGVGEHGGWLSTRYSFSFAEWYDPSRMGFGRLRVLNDDKIAPASGFGAHPHKDMEIITLVLGGAVSHADNMGNRKKVSAGEVQVMSAGTGVLHAEKNESPSEPLELFQIWVEPKEYGVVPRYDQAAFDFAKPGATLLVASKAKGDALTINQDAYLTLVNLDRDFTYTLHNAKNGVYLFVIEGSVDVAGHTLGARDALGVSDTGEIPVTTGVPARLLCIEVPL